MGDRSALAVLSGKARKHIEQHVHEDENVGVVMQGASHQTLVGLDDRLLIVKPGVMAGASFGAKVTSFNYSDISAIEVNTNWRTGVIEVITSGYQGTKGTKYWSSDAEHDPFKISNCIPIPKKAAQEWTPYLQWLRQKITEAKGEGQPAAAPKDDLVSSLERLESLRSAGTLTDAEFEQAKARLLA
jgi:hypothetical protein